jgi:molybdenum cofactor cytidylyltransferase
VIAGLILAAGAGERFGTQPKLLAELHGLPLLQHVVAAASRVSALDRVVVVLGAHAEALIERVDMLRAEPVICADWREGQASSLRCGLSALSGTEKVIVLLGDQPSISPGLIQRFVLLPPRTRAVYHGRPGHPVVLGLQEMRRVGRLRGDYGARELLRDGPRVECSDLACGRDVDNPEDLEAIRHEAGTVV